MVVRGSFLSPAEVSGLNRIGNLIILHPALLNHRQSEFLQVWFLRGILQLSSFNSRQPRQTRPRRPGWEAEAPRVPDTGAAGDPVVWGRLFEHENHPIQSSCKAVPMRGSSNISIYCTSTRYSWLLGSRMLGELNAAGNNSFLSDLWWTFSIGAFVSPDLLPGFSVKLDWFINF